MSILLRVIAEDIIGIARIVGDFLEEFYDSIYFPVPGNDFSDEKYKERANPKCTKVEQKCIAANRWYKEVEDMEE